jgi:hypothetical protein
MIWNPKADGLIDHSDSETAKQLYGLLNVAAEPLRFLSIKPILVARVIVPSRWPNQGLKALHRLQYGPHEWETDYLSPYGDLEPYQKSILEMGAELEKGEWVRLGGALLAQTFGLESPPADGQLDVLVVFQDDARLFAFRDQVSKASVAYEIAESGLRFLGRPHSECFTKLEYAPRKPVLSLEEGAAPKRKTMEELRCDVLWRYATKLCDATKPLFLEAFDKMRSIAPEVAMAHSASRFNDAHNDEYWTAVRVNNFAWENGSYFKNGAASLASAPASIHQVLGLLHHLLACQIGRRFTATYGMYVTPLDAIGFFLQDSECYFACSCTNGDDGPVYRIDPRTGDSEFVGVALRFDWNFNSGSVDSHRAVPEERCLEWAPIDLWLEWFPHLKDCARLEAFPRSEFPLLAGIDKEAYFPSDEE